MVCGWDRNDALDTCDFDGYLDNQATRQTGSPLIEIRRERGGPALYRQIADALRQRIDDGLSPGARLPSEPELADQLGVARATVAKAFDLLVADGQIVRERGKGTFVAEPPMVRRLPELTGFSEHITSLGRRSGQRLLSYQRVSGSYVDPLLAPFEDRDLALVERLRLVDGAPAGLHRVAIPLDLAERIGFTEERLGSDDVSLYECFVEHGVALAWGEEHLRAINADEQAASLLQLDVGAALMHVRRFTYDAADQLVEAVDAQYIGRLYDYSIAVARPSTDPGTKETKQHVGTTIPVGRVGSGLRFDGGRVRRQRRW